MTFLLDTNVVSALRRPDRAAPAVVQWSATVPADQVFISVITLLEIERGILQQERAGTPFGVDLRHWMRTHVLPNHSGTALPVTTDIALRAATFVDLPTVELADHLIAATALVHDLVVVTRNTAHFHNTGARLFNPWTA